MLQEKVKQPSTACGPSVLLPTWVHAKRGDRVNGAEVRLRVFAYSFRYNSPAVLIYVEHRAGPGKSQTLEATMVV